MRAPTASRRDRGHGAVVDRLHVLREREHHARERRAFSCFGRAGGACAASGRARRHGSRAQAASSGSCFSADGERGASVGCGSAMHARCWKSRGWPRASGFVLCRRRATLRPQACQPQCRAAEHGTRKARAERGAMLTPSRYWSVEMSPPCSSFSSSWKSRSSQMKRGKKSARAASTASRRPRRGRESSSSAAHARGTGWWTNERHAGRCKGKPPGSRHVSLKPTALRYGVRSGTGDDAPRAAASLLRHLRDQRELIDRGVVHRLVRVVDEE